MARSQMAAKDLSEAGMRKRFETDPRFVLMVHRDTSRWAQEHGRYSVAELATGTFVKHFHTLSELATWVDKQSQVPLDFNAGMAGFNEALRQRQMGLPAN